jgi:hypothetical protein
LRAFISPLIWSTGQETPVCNHMPAPRGVLQ